MFTIENTPNEVLADPQIRTYLPLFFPDFMLNLLTEDCMDKPLTYARDHIVMPWGAPFLSEGLVSSVNLLQDILSRHTWVFRPLWQDASRDYIPQISHNDRTSVCLMTSNTQPTQKKPAVLIMPGGGYSTMSVESEGMAYARRFEEKGYKAFVLLYRVAPNTWPAPQLDTALAMKYLRIHADEWQIDPDSILLVGSSAGGHLAASFAADYAEYETLLMQELEASSPALAQVCRNVPIRPNRLLLAYPVISFLSEAHEPSFTALTGGRGSDDLRRKLSLETRVDASYPETFVWACEDDGLVPVSNAKRMGAALEKAGVHHMLKIYPQGDHGCGLAQGTSAQGWFDEAMQFFSDLQEAPAK